MGKNIDYMMELVNEYLSGKTPRHIFELDFETEILDRGSQHFSGHFLSNTF